MTADRLTSIRELNSRLTDGLQVRLLWDADDGRLWVTVLHTRMGHLFNVEVGADERPLDVFNHPFAYAAHHGIDTDVRPRRSSAVEAPA